MRTDRFSGGRWRPALLAGGIAILLASSMLGPGAIAHAQQRGDPFSIENLISQGIIPRPTTPDQLRTISQIINDQRAQIGGFTGTAPSGIPSSYLNLAQQQMTLFSIKWAYRGLTDPSFYQSAEYWHDKQLVNQGCFPTCTADDSSSTRDRATNSPRAVLDQLRAMQATSLAGVMSPRRIEAAAAEQEANQLDAESPTPQDCIAEMATARSGPQRDLPGGCLSDTDRMSVYRGSPSSGAAPQPGGSNPEPIIDGSNIPSQIDFSSGAPNGVFVGPPAPEPSSQPTPGRSSDPESAPNTPSTVPPPTFDSTAPPLPPPGTAPWNGGRASTPAPDGPTAPLEVLPADPPEPSSPGPIREPGAPDDTLPNHQADMDQATNGWNYIKNPLKYPLEILRVVYDKISRILEFQPPEDK